MALKQEYWEKYWPIYGSIEKAILDSGRTSPGDAALHQMTKSRLREQYEDAVSAQSTFKARTQALVEKAANSYRTLKETHRHIIEQARQTLQNHQWTAVGGLVLQPIAYAFLALASAVRFGKRVIIHQKYKQLHKTAEDEFPDDFLPEAREPFGKAGGVSVVGFYGHANAAKRFIKQNKLT